MSKHQPTRFSYLFFFIVLLLNLFQSCSEDEVIREPVFYANDFAINVFENPEKGQFVGQIKAYSESGGLDFKIIEELPIGALNINSGNGEITVKDPLQFDWETYRSVMLKVEVTNGDKTKLVLVSIQILDRVEQDNYFLKQMIERGFNDGGDIIYEIETNYEMGKITSRYHNTGRFKDELFSYNSQGLMSEHVIIENGIISETVTIDYDDTFRISRIDHAMNDMNNNWAEVYSYLSDNEILAQETNGQGIVFERRFVLDEGMVIEEWVDDYSPLFKATYKNNRIHYMFDQVSDIHYTYEESGTNPQRNYEKMFAKIPSNIVLYHENLSNAADFFTDDLIKEKVYQNDLPFTVRYEYELNEVDLAVYSKETMEEEGKTRLVKETFYEFEKRTMEGGLIRDILVQ